VPFLTKAGLYLTFAPDKAAMWVKGLGKEGKALAVNVFG
jgi:hypothetical protein